MEGNRARLPCVTAIVATLVAVLLSTTLPRPSAARYDNYYTRSRTSRSLLQVNAGYCDQSSNGGCEKYCQGFSGANYASQTCKSVFVDNQELTASCVAEPNGIGVPCAHTSKSRAGVPGCFCCCVKQTGTIDTNPLVGGRCTPNAAIDGSSCDKYCKGFKEVSNVCSSINSGGTIYRPSCAKNNAGQQIACSHTSVSQGGPNNCHCCCTAAAQAPVTGQSADEAGIESVDDGESGSGGSGSSALGWGLFAAVVVVVCGGAAAAYFTICKPKGKAAAPNAVPVVPSAAPAEAKAVDPSTVPAEEEAVDASEIKPSASDKTN
mmetsp:Transcript_25390/g.71022  ORF Transcript_25390/g.71022 Transcript_25390/m.71022 type:complete len:320 (+) Transcript_25390:405-1364(+)|eukprot:CAMPEP_0117674608 /NCGR_PEP_ID=MMETSP0804-20121206/15133_1 /TAXON_ID=1074897 /ORGANISM="Tetraselmis astigmatica, Strain CCMP880" /LENGTH=319 /DNA_ID=CAMNT_0005483497 /DNA_START=326 /DNA_END=1285 /DNA_ORIENTATION=-